jgi:hypothetical protein
MTDMDASLIYETSNRLRTRKPLPIPDLDMLPGNAVITRKQLALLSGFSEQALKKWAREGRGPRLTMIEGHPRYRADDSRAWLSGEAA